MKLYHVDNNHIEFSDGRRYILSGEVMSSQEKNGFLSIVQSSKYDGLFYNDIYALSFTTGISFPDPILHTLTQRDSLVYPADAFFRSLLLPSNHVKKWSEPISQVIQVEDNVFVFMHNGSTQNLRRKSIFGIARDGKDIWSIHQDRFDPCYPLGAEYFAMELRLDGDVEAYRDKGGSDIINARTGLIDMSYLDYSPIV